MPSTRVIKKYPNRRLYDTKIKVSKIKVSGTVSGEMSDTRLWVALID